MKILIATEPDDSHALSVKLALEEMGHTCDLWFTANMPSLQTNSLYISDNCFNWFMEEKSNKKTMNEPVDVVWWRRPRKPYIPETAHPNDQSCIKKENQFFYDSIPLLAASNAWWINPYESIKYADSKIYQLKVAPIYRLKIPPSLVSNSPKHIKAFLNNNDAVIYKPFFPNHWFENNQLKFYYTKPVTVNELPSDKLLQMTPGIFQQQISKSFELRVTCFGDYLVAIKIDSQDHPKTLNDWRVAPSHELKLEPYELSNALQISIRHFMKHLGIIFGCFDFIVTPDDDIYFLEVNQQGQFLWIEDILPEIPLLDIFVNFLLHKRVDFHWRPYESRFRLSDYHHEISERVNQQIAQNVYLNEIKKQEMTL